MLYGHAECADHLKTAKRVPMSSFLEGGGGGALNSNASSWDALSREQLIQGLSDLKSLHEEELKQRKSVEEKHFWEISMLKSEMVDVKKQLSELGSLVRHLLNSGGGEVESAFEARLAESARSQYLRDRETVGGVRVETAQIAEASGYETETMNNDSKSEEPGKKDEDPEIDTQGSRPDEDEVNRGEGPEGIEEVEHSANADDAKEVESVVVGDPNASDVERAQTAWNKK